MVEFFQAKSSATGDMRWFPYTRGTSTATPPTEPPDDTESLDVALLRQALVDQAALIDSLLSRVAALEARSAQVVEARPIQVQAPNVKGVVASEGKAKPKP